VTQVNTRAAHEAAVARMSSLSRSIDTLQGQLATGKRITAPADDPVAFTRAAVLRRADTAATATRRGLDAASRRLNATDIALEGVSNLVQRARELALQGSTGTLSAGDRALLATEVGELSEQFAGLADARGSDGERLFGGAAAQSPAYALDANGIMVWQGAGDAPSVLVGGSRIDSGLEGPEAFGATDPATGSEDLFATLTNLQTALGEPDPMLRETAMANSLTQIDGHIDRLATARATAGARMARIDTESERIAKASLATQSDLTRLESLDMAEGIARLQRLITVLQAAQGSFVATTNLSLWDQLR
jgi:flagellar hook-associated protein 3 FlgL